MPELDALSVGSLALIAAAIAFAGYIQGALGFGFALISTPVTAMLTDMRTAIVVVLVPTLFTTLTTLFASGSLGPVLARFWMMPLYAFAGAYVGTSIFVAAPHFPYQLLLAAMILVYLNLDRLARGEWPRIRAHERGFGPVSGMMAGLFETTANVSAPPLIIYYLALGIAPALMVQGMQICFLIGKTTQFAVLSTQGGVTGAQWLATLPLAGCAVAGVLVGTRLRGKIRADVFRLWVKRGMLVIALVLLAQDAYLRWLT
jgi:uncharacterized membrane protein YfcA